MKQLMTDGELSVFSGQLAMILHSGISTLEGIEILKEDAVSKEAGEILGWSKPVILLKHFAPAASFRNIL